MLKEVILDDFEHGENNRYETNHFFVTSYKISLSNDQSKFGKSSLKLEYNFSGWLSGNGAMIIKFKEDLGTDILPCRFGLWVYGDGKSPWLRAIFVDGEGERKTVNLTPENIDWHGWKYLDVPIDSNWRLPLRLDQIYAVETNKIFQADPNCCGVIYFDRLRFVYVDDEDLTGPRFSDISPKSDVVYKDTFTFYTTVTDEMSGVDPKSIVLKINNKRTIHHFCEKSSQISYQFNQVEQGIYHITIDAKDNAGNKAIPNIDRRLIVDLSPDIDKPLLSNLTPTETAIVYTNTPRITFKLIDEKSGINVSDIFVAIDGKRLDVTYDESTGWGYAVSLQSLRVGEHYFSITAIDRSGNQLGPIKKKFTIKGIDPPKDWNNFRVSVIPDTHSNKYGQASFQRAVDEDTDFVIQMGDLVDQANEEEYKCLQNNLGILKNKPILTVPGNHEAFRGNLDFYMNIFGSPTYHVEYGNTLFIFLNTAYDQSINASDSTQFDYLKKVIKNNKRKNVIITTHVPTKDVFGTAHDMKKTEAEELEQILADYKKENKDVNITVLFGHLHVLQQWKIAGVHYIITGNGAAKGYVANKRGNILGHGVLSVSDSGIEYCFIPYVSKIFINNDVSYSNEIKLAKGTDQKLHVFGEVCTLNSSYTICLTDFDLVDKAWTSSNTEVVYIDKSSIVHAKDIGNATVTILINGKIATLKVYVTDNKGDTSYDQL